MSTRCAVCLHDRHVEADALYSSGRSAAFVARLLGVSIDSARRHRRFGHVSRPTTTPVIVASVADPDAPLDALAHLRGQLAALDAMDVTRMSPNQAMSVMDARRRTVAEIAKVQPPAPPPETPTVARFLEILDDVIARHPDKRRRFMAAWREFRGMGPEPVVETEQVSATLGAPNAVEFTRPKREGS